MEEPKINHRRGSAQAAPASSTFLEAHDHTRLWLQSKLSGDWSAQTAASGLTEERLNTLSRCFGSLDSMVKVRLMLAGLFVPSRDRSRLQPQLSELSSQAASNQDEWVRATAAAVGDFSGLLDMRSLMAQFPLVRESVQKFSSQLSEMQTPPSLLPQTEQYMHRDISRQSTVNPSRASASVGGVRQHFRLREVSQAGLGDMGPGGPASAASGGGGGNAGLAGVAGSGLSVGGLILTGSGSGSLMGAGSLVLDSKGSTGPGPNPSGETAVVRRGMSQSGVGGGEMSILRTRADVSHSKDLKQGPPTPGGKTALNAASGPSLRIARTRSLMIADQQLPWSESVQGGGTPAAAVAAAAAGAGAGTPSANPATAAAACNPATAFTTASISTLMGGVSATAGSSGAAGPVAMAVSLPPLAPSVQQHVAQPVGAAGPPVAMAGASPTSIPRRDSRQGAMLSWQTGQNSTTPVSTATTTTAQHYPLAEAIAIAAAAASGGVSAGAAAGMLSTTTTNTTEQRLPLHTSPSVQQQQQQQQQQQRAPLDFHSLMGPGGYCHERQGPIGDAAQGEGGDGSGAGHGELDEQTARQPLQSFDRAYSGSGPAREGSVVEGGGGWLDYVRTAEFNRGTDFRINEVHTAGTDEHHAKRPRMDQ